MAKRGKLEGRFTVPTGGWDLTVAETGGGTSTVTVPAGDYYLSSGEVAGGDSFLDVLAGELNDDSTLVGAYAVTISAGEGGTGKVTITESGGTVTSLVLAWDDTDLRDLLGFSGDEAAALAVTGDYHARALWLPDCAPQALNGGVWPGVYESDIQARESASGEVYVAAGEVKVAREDLRWPAVSQAKTWKYSETVTGESFERFWLDVIIGRASWAQPGGPVRYHADADDADNYWTYRATGPASFRPEQVRQNWAGKFAVQMARWVLLPQEVDKEPPGDPPEAAFVASVDGHVVTFTDASSDPEGRLESWSLDPGDGSAPYTGAGPWVHEYPSIDEFTATLTVTDAGGLSDSYAATITTEGDYVYVGRFAMATDGQDLIIPGLSGDSHGEYMLRGHILVPSATIQAITLRPNGLATNLVGVRSNEFGVPTDTTEWEVTNHTASFTGSPLLVEFEAEVSAAKTLNGVARQRTVRGRTRLCGNASGLEVFLFEFGGAWQETATELTSFTLHSNIATGILGGSEVLVYRPDKVFTL